MREEGLGFIVVMAIVYLGIAYIAWLKLVCQAVVVTGELWGGYRCR